MKRKHAHDLLVTCVTEYKADFYRLAYSYVKNEQDALDIVQESIHKALISIDSMKDPKSVKSWFYKIVVRTALDFLRKRKKQVPVDSDVLESLKPGQGDHYEDIDLHESIDQLPLQYKTIVILRFFEDLKLEDIAHIVDENVSTVKTRLYRALKLLRLNISEEDID